LLVADHSQCAAALTLNVPEAPSLLYDALVGEISIVHAATPSWRTATDCPATVNVPVRSAVLAFAVKLTVTVPFPAPLAPLPIVIQPLSEAAVHVQLAAAVTVTEPEPPAATNERDEAESEYVHGPGLGWVGELSLPQAEIPINSTASTGRHRDEFLRIVTSCPVASATTQPDAADCVSGVTRLIFGRTGACTSRTGKFSVAVGDIPAVPVSASNATPPAACVLLRSRCRR
jgi:hypothetical protein